MSINNFLKKSSLYNVLTAESLVSEEFRDKLAKISKLIIYILVFVLLFLYFTKNSARFDSFKEFVEKYSLTSRVLGLVLINIGIFIYSHLAQFYLSSTYYFEKIIENKYNKDELYTFSAGRILYAGRKTDILHGFLKSKIGKIVFIKLGISKKDRKAFYKSQSIKDIENVPAHEGNVLKVKDILMYLYSENEEFVEFLNHRGVSNKNLLDTADIVISEIEGKEYKKQWWRPEILAKIKPLIK